MVAPGYMFSNLDNDGNLSFGLTWCSSLDNVNLVQENDAHHHHDNNGPVNHSNNGEHFTAVCGLLAGSTNFIHNNSNFADGFVLPKYNYIQIEYDDAIYKNSYRHSHSARAPPFLIIV